MLADMWQLPAISTAAADVLAQTLTSQGKLSEAATDQLMHMQAVPNCLQPLMQPVLLSVLADLEECWANANLCHKLLRLPLHNMELLLSSSELKVSHRQQQAAGLLWTAHSVTV
jgi:hypothetical protein